MSLVPDNDEIEEEKLSSSEEIIKWLKVIAVLLGEMVDEDSNDIYEDIDNGNS